jgi:hypothetical protein
MMPLEPDAHEFIPGQVADLEQSTVDHWAFATIPTYPAFAPFRQVMVAWLPQINSS